MINLEVQLQKPINEYQDHNAPKPHGCIGRPILFLIDAQLLKLCEARLE